MVLAKSLRTDIENLVSKAKKQTKKERRDLPPSHEGNEQKFSNRLANYVLSLSEEEQTLLYSYLELKLNGETARLINIARQRFLDKLGDAKRITFRKLEAKIDFYLLQSNNLKFDFVVDIKTFGLRTLLQPKTQLINKPQDSISTKYENNIQNNSFIHLNAKEDLHVIPKNIVAERIKQFEQARQIFTPEINEDVKIIPENIVAERVQQFEQATPAFTPKMNEDLNVIPKNIVADRVKQFEKAKSIFTPQKNLSSATEIKHAQPNHKTIVPIKMTASTTATSVPTKQTAVTSEDDYALALRLQMEELGNHTKQQASTHKPFKVPQPGSYRAIAMGMQLKEIDDYVKKPQTISQKPQTSHQPSAAEKICVDLIVTTYVQTQQLHAVSLLMDFFVKTIALHLQAIAASFLNAVSLKPGLFSMNNAKQIHDKNNNESNELHFRPMIKI